MKAENVYLLGRWLAWVGGPQAGWRVLGIALIVGLVGALLGLWQASQRPPFYQVQVVMAIYPTHFRWNATTVIQTLQRPRNDARNMAMVMAQGPNVLTEVIRRMGDRLPPTLRNPGVLRRQLIVRGGEGIYVYLTVNGTDPELTYELATTWAQVVEEEVETSFYRYDVDIPAMEDQLTELEAQLQAIEAEIEAFRARTGYSLVDVDNLVAVGAGEETPRVIGWQADVVRWAYATSTLGEYEHAQAVLLQLAEQVTNAEQTGQSLDTVPLELVDTLPAVQRRGRLSAAQLRALAQHALVAERLRAEAEALQPAIDLLREEVTRAQETLAGYKTRFRDLVRQRDAVERLYKALLAKREELRAEAAVADAYVRIVEVRPPQRAGTSSQLIQVLAGAVLGAFLGFWTATTWYSIRRARAASHT